jgi:hypothetical protein
MFRTRDLVVIVVSILLTMVVWVIVVILSPEPESTSVTSPTPVVLSTPKDSYEVVPYEEGNTLREGREAFIEKVKRTYIPPPLSTEDDVSTPSIPEPVTPAVSEPIPEPSIVVPPPMPPAEVIPPSATTTSYVDPRL